MNKYKLVSRASTSGFKKIEERPFDLGFPECNLFPVEHNGKVYIPTGYVCYERLNEVKQNE